MKILCLADRADPGLWEFLDRRRLEGVELILACGDLPASYLSFLTCFTSAPILYVHGNHDDNYEKRPPEGCICIEDVLYIHNGMRILGLGGCTRYKEGPNQYTEHEMSRRIRKLRRKLRRSKGFDILMTHAPARSLGDREDICHRGFTAFLTLMDSYAPRLMIHGHVHDNYGIDFQRERTYGSTRVVNVCGSYVIEIDTPNT